MEPLNPAQYRNDAARLLAAALDAIEGLSDTHPSRELSLARTNVEQAQMWFDRVPTLFVTKTEGAV